MNLSHVVLSRFSGYINWGYTGYINIRWNENGFWKKLAKHLRKCQNRYRSDTTSRDGQIVAERESTATVSTADDERANTTEKKEERKTSG